MTRDVDVSKKSGVAVVRLELRVVLVLVVSALDGELTVKVAETESSLGPLRAAMA